MHLGFNEELLEEERKRMRSEHEKELTEMRTKMESEKQTKAAMQKEIELMKQQYEDKLQDLEKRAERSKTANQRSPSITDENGKVINPILQRQISVGKGGEVIVKGGGGAMEMIPEQGKQMNQMQQEAMIKLKKLQEEMIDGGKRAGDKNLKERRKQKKKAAESRLKALGEALGHVDDEDGVLLKVYDDIQEELKVKTDALKKSKQRVKALNVEIQDCKQFTHSFSFTFSMMIFLSAKGIRRRSNGLPGHDPEAGSTVDTFAADIGEGSADHSQRLQLRQFGENQERRHLERRESTMADS